MAFPPDLFVFERDAGFGAGLWRRVFATVWRETPTAERLRTCGRFQDEVTRRCPDGFVALAVLPSQHAHLSPDVREAAEELSRNPSPALAAIAQVITGTGFVAAATRMVATGMSLLNRRTPTKWFDSVQHAAEWLSPRVARIPDAQAVSAPEIVSAFAEL
ncbi:MAG TPA: hypothetical protein VF765_29250 [Polyangiaceae bacterium]